MSTSEKRLAVWYTREHFGELCSALIEKLITQTSLSLQDLTSTKGVDSRNQLKKSLCTLIQHGVVDYKANSRGTIFYATRVRELLYRSRFTRYLEAVRTMLGARGELVVADVLQHGRVRIGDVMERVRERREDGDERSVREVDEETIEMCGKLIEMKMLFAPCRHVPPEVDEQGCAASVQSHNPFELPTAITSFLQEKTNSTADSSQPAAKRRKLNQPITSKDTTPLQLDDGGIFYHLNFSQFHRHFLHQAIVGAVQQKVDPIASVIIKTILSMTSSKPLEFQFGETTASVSSFELFQHLPAVPLLSRDEMNQYLSILTNDSTRFLIKVGEQGGGTYAINVGGMKETLCEQTIESVVRERFGSRSLRVFRLLVAKKHLEQKQVGELAMIPAKESKELLYKLFVENFVTVQEIPRSGDHAPSRTFYLFTVNLEQVRRLLLTQCYETAANLTSRRHVEMEKNERLIEKSQRCETIAETLRTSGNASKEDLAEVEEMMTPAEQQQLERHRKTVKKLEQAELQLEDTIITLSKYE